MAKILKLANSYGSVSKMSNASRRRKPYIVRVTTSYTLNEESGIRKVPISDYIYPFIKNWYESSHCDRLLHTEEQKPFKYRNYYNSYFLPLMEQLGFDQTPHCCRHTCISLLAEAGVSPTYSKMIVGHKGAMTMTEKVYTHIDMKILIDAVNQMYYPENIKSFIQ